MRLGRPTCFLALIAAHRSIICYTDVHCTLKAGNKEGPNCQTRVDTLKLQRRIKNLQEHRPVGGSLMSGPETARHE